MIKECHGRKVATGQLTSEALAMMCAKPADSKGAKVFCLSG
jgi:hypothetical protein